ncbi:unnamed protein product [Sphenostylis stenocarpa]|uniref:MOM1 alpha-helical domain-containing protein n=1 Tax=Sphenostylis stenocarpa TaxID=92480 RepID=A0AA87BDB8_9FABA|nr:unnamed protein product [Sphenostylis stenocarpa]
MTNGSSRVAEKGLITRSSRETLSKKVAATFSNTPNRKSERLEKRTPPSPAGRMDQKRSTETPSPLRRSERRRTASPSYPSPSRGSGSCSRTPQKRHCIGKQLVFEASENGDKEDEERGVEASSRPRTRSIVYGMDRSTKKGDDGGGGKIDGCLKKGNCLDSANDDKDIRLPEDATGKKMRVEPKLSEPVKELSCNNATGNRLIKSNTASCEPCGTPEKVQFDSSKEERLPIFGSLDYVSNENFIRRCIEHDKDKKSISPKRKRTIVDMHSDTSTMLVDNDNNLSLIKDTRPSRMCSNVVETSGSCSKRIRPIDMQISLSDEKRDWRKSTNNVDQPSSKLSTRNREGQLKSCLQHITHAARIIVADDVLHGCTIRCFLLEILKLQLFMSFSPCLVQLLVFAIVFLGKIDGLELVGISGITWPFELVGSAISVARSLGPQGNAVETEKIRKQQRSLHLLLKPEIANLCQILHLPVLCKEIEMQALSHIDDEEVDIMRKCDKDDVKSMVQNCLEYTMNNYQICTEPLPILQAFQLSLCLTAAALLNHKLNFEASLLLAKQHLNFDCKKEVVDEINSRLWDLKESFLLLTGNSNVAGYAKASQSSSGASSYMEVTPEAELVKIDNSINIKSVQKRKRQWKKLLLMQREEKIRLKKDIENENTEFRRKHQIEWEAIQSCSPNDLTNEGKLQFESEYTKRTRELNRQQEIRLKDLEAKQLKSRLMFQESLAPDELLNPVGSNKLGTMVKSLQISDRDQHHDASKALVPDHVAKGKGFNDIVEVMARTESGVGLSEASDANASVVASCSSTVELQTSPVKHADANDMDIVTSKDEVLSGIKCNNIVANEYQSQGNIISKYFKSGERYSEGAIKVPNKEEGCVNFSHESHNDFGNDPIMQALPSSNEDICHGDTLGVCSGEVAPSVYNTSSSTNDLVEIPSSRQGELNGIVQIRPVCGSSIEVEANGSNDGAKNMAVLNSQSSEEHIPYVNTLCAPNCETTAQIHDADNNYSSNQADTLNSSLNDERISSWNSKSPQDHVHNKNGTWVLNCEKFARVDGNDSDNFILNSTLVERNVDRNVVLNRDAHVGILDALNLTSSTEQIARDAQYVSVLDSVLSRPCGANISSNCSDANAIILSNQPSTEKQNHHGVSSSITVGQIPVEVSETNERATLNVLDGEEAVSLSMPDTVNYPDNVIPQNSSSMDQLPNGDPVLDGNLSSGPSTTSPNNGQTLPDEQVSVLVPGNSHGEAECQLTRNMDKRATLDQQEGLCKTMTENSLTQETPVDFMEPLEQVQPLSSVKSPPDLDTSREMQNNVVSSPVDVVPDNQSISDSPVMEPPKEVQFPSAGVPSSNRDLCNLPLMSRTEDHPYNEDDLLNHTPGTLIEIQNQAIVQHPSNSDQQEGVCRNMSRNSLSQGTPVSRSVDDLMEPVEQVQTLPSLESPDDRNTTIEMQNSLVSSSVDIVLANLSINDSLVMEPPEKEGQLPSAGILPSNRDLSNLPMVTGTENQPSNEDDDFPNHTPKTSIEIQNQAVGQCTSIAEHDSCCQVVHPASNMDFVSLMLAGVRQQSSDTRNLSTLPEINHHPIQPASQSDSRIHFPHDLLNYELERLHKQTEENIKNYAKKQLSQLKVDLAKDLEKVTRKYDIIRKENEAELQKVTTDLDKQNSIVHVNMKLAEAWAKFMDDDLTGTLRLQKDTSSVQQLFQRASPQNATRPNMVASPSTCGHPAASLQSFYATTTSQTTVPPIQATYNTPGTFSIASSRLQRINSLSSPLGDLQTGGEIRAPAPHLHPYRPTTSLPASNLCTALHGRPSLPAPCNGPVTSPPFSHQTPQPTPAAPFPFHGHWPVSTGGSSSPNLPAINTPSNANSQHGIYLPNVPPHMPDFASANRSKYFKSSSTSATSPDVVCLSDDE